MNTRVVLARLRQHLLLAGGFMNHQPQLIIDLDQFVNAGTTAISGVLAAAATHRPVDQLAVDRLLAQQLPLCRRGLYAMPAVLAQQAHEALRHHRNQAGGQQEGLDAHILQAGDRADGGIGVQRGQYQVPGEGGLHRDLRRFQVADLPHHHNVRVLAQDRPQAAGKGHIHLGIDLGLADPGQHVFDGILDSEDIARAFIDV